MGFVKTSEELQKIQGLLAAPAFVNGERLAVEFETDPEVVARLLPPPLEPAEQPIASVGIGRWQGNGIGDYAGGSLYLACRHGEVEGGYALAMWMDAEPAVLFGREVFGEPKKLAISRLFRGAAGISATIERHGTVLVEIRGEDFGSDQGASQEDRVAFNYRSRTAADGAGLDGPATLTETVFSASVRSEIVGTGGIELRGTPHDPLDEIPVLSVGRAVFAEHDISARCRAVASVDAEVFLPYHHGRGSDDWLLLDSTA